MKIVIGYLVAFGTLWCACFVAPSTPHQSPVSLPLPWIYRNATDADRLADMFDHPEVAFTLRGNNAFIIDRTIPLTHPVIELPENVTILCKADPCFNDDGLKVDFYHRGGWIYAYENSVVLGATHHAYLTVGWSPEYNGGQNMNVSPIRSGLSIGWGHAKSR